MGQIDWMLFTQVVLAAVSIGGAAIAFWNAKIARYASDAAKQQADAAKLQAEAARVQADAAIQQAKHAEESVKLAREANDLMARQVAIQESANVTRLRVSIRFQDGPFGANSPVPIVTIVNDGNLPVNVEGVVFLTRTGHRIKGDRTWKGGGGPFLPRSIGSQHRIDAFWDRDQLRANVLHLREPVSVSVVLSNGSDWPGPDEAETRPIVDQFLRAIQD